MNILKEIDSLDINDKDELEYMLNILESRLDIIEDMEPNSDGETHDNWEERYDDLEDIIEAFREVENEEELNEIKERLLNHQLEYGGLKRFRY